MQACCGVDGGPALPNFDPSLPNVDLRVTAETCNCNFTATYAAAAAAEGKLDSLANGSFAPCDVPILPDTSPKWSHSAHCRNYIYTQAEAQTLGASWGSFQGLCILFGLPVLGKIADLYGRQKVYYWTTVSTVTTFAVFAIDAKLDLGDGAVLATAPLMASYGGHQLLAWAMMIDLFPDPKDQAKWFPAVAPFIGRGGGVSLPAMVGDIISYFVLRWHEENYFMIWACLTIVAFVGMLVIWFMVPETLKDPKPWPGWSEFAQDIFPCCGKAARGDSGTSYTHSFKVWCAGPAAGDLDGASLSRRSILRTVMVITLMAGLADSGTNALEKNTMLGPLGFLQEDLAFVSIFTKIVYVAGAAAGAVLLPRLGPWRGMVLGIALRAAQGFFFTTMGQLGPFVSKLFGAFGMSLVGPASMIYIAAALQPSELAMAQSALGIYHTIPAIIAGPLFTVLFWGTLTQITVGYLLAGAIGCGCLAVTVLFLPRDLAQIGEQRAAAAVPP